ncbi:MAG TPA: lyase family protein, partial [Bacteroidia bacterium]|nr:lyase family protein [Bacteroidia bacterium]
MEINPLNSISPIDGRYRNQTEELSAYFSEASLMRYRLIVEVEYFISLCQLPLPQLKAASPAGFEKLRDLYRNFNNADAENIKAHEKITNHDVKALEYFLKEKLVEFGYGDYKEFVHFGLTSQDINNTAFPLAIKDAVSKVYLPKMREVIQKLTLFSEEWSKVPMLSRTHGQPASPTRLGKEFLVFVERIAN